MDAADLEAVLAEAGRFVSEVIAPTNRTGDQQGSVRQRRRLGFHTALGFKEAYRSYQQAGWGAAPFSAEWGGGNQPWVIGGVVSEMLTSANMAFSLCPMLTQGAIHLLSAHGDVEQQARWLPKLISGEWAGTMNLTEPQAGSDVGALTSPSRAAARRHLSPVRSENLHHLGRARPHRQHRASSAGPHDWRRARHTGHLLLHRAEILGESRRQHRRTQRHLLASP